MKGKMLRFPMHGFARRVDDAVARAMAMLMARDSDTARLSAAPVPSPVPELIKLD